MRSGSLLAAALSFAFSAGTAVAATLEGFARLNASTLMPGPDSGHFIEAGENIELPFQGQPAQGFSAIIQDGNGGYLALVDNGFGSRENSPDFLLRIYFLNPEFRTAEGGSGDILIDGYINLSDPGGLMPYPITASRECLDSQDPCLEVNEAAKTGRLLTGADLDPESLQETPDGSLWIGDEIGPYLGHFDATGALLEAPFELQGLVSESRPDSEKTTHTLRHSRGFEGMAKSPNGGTLYPMLEGSLDGQQGLLNIYSFDVEGRRFLNGSADEPSFRYQLNPAATAIGAFKLANETTGLVIERDSGEGANAKHKKIYRVDFSQTNEENILVKIEIADLLKIEDPHDLNQDGKTMFTFPMATMEGLAILDSGLLAIISDNNYPFGRARGREEPEATEFILIDVGDLW